MRNLCFHLWFENTGISHRAFLILLGLRIKGEEGTKKDIVFILEAVMALACERAIEYKVV